ncbi:Major facilitator superfamily MFS_1 [Seminavis robusta]|uniref:Major facilitator superfamily MFS_1 n=1 Tax=Seminavis robusta TaxID=568900 RepID=A0A9N8E1W9_9STRA|nr:Major facilitator superfamily MFS_1 [Seminavis robusta]|eukprot:Sro568_g168210.1 Major facilitator superfamily MFS_1 (702) ;mRNA; r:40450-42650
MNTDVEDPSLAKAAAKQLMKRLECHEETGASDMAKLMEEHEHEAVDYDTGIDYSIHGSPKVKKGKHCTLSEMTQLSPRHRLVAEEDSLKWSMMAVRIAVLATACSQTILQPNFPFLAIPGRTPYSFPSTDPFDFSAALYFLPMTTLLGTAITSAFIGSVSDRVGRRPCILLCMTGMIAGLVGQWFARHTFWGFCAASFACGLFCSAMPVAMAYASDVHPNRAKKDEEIGAIVGFNMIGMSGGGVVAILMENENLFSPLLVGAGVSFAALIFCFMFLIEPDKCLIPKDEESDEDEGDAPESINWCLFGNVIAGALLDNIGSSGLFPMALAPLAFKTFYSDFIMAQQDPIMTDVAYKWLSVCVALMVIPGAALTQPVFARIGAAGGCVVGNAITGVGIVICLYITRIDPPTTTTFAIFIVALYLIFPLTVISQLSTGPMLDMLAPQDRRGFAQGINMTVMSFAFAVSPWILGVMADEIGIFETMWTCVGVSFLAALVNSPLMFAPALKRKPPVNYQAAVDLEDQELVDRALRGDWVPAKFIDDLNYSRFQKGLPFLRLPIKEYQDDKENVKALKKNAKSDFEYHRFVMHDILNDLEQPDGKRKNIEILNKTIPPQADIDADAEAMGRWFTEYLKDGGYFLDGGWPPVYKQMIMQAFPPINTDGELTEENVEPTVLRYLANMNRFLREDTQSRANKGFRNSVIV